MSGVIGHSMYAILAAKKAVEHRLPITSLIEQYPSSYLCGAYLGCDVQTMPEAICEDTGQEVGYGTAPLESSPVTGGSVRPWSLEFNGKQFRPREIHRTFYGRAHLVFGWNGSQRIHTVPWDHLPDYCADVFHDAITLDGANAPDSRLAQGIDRRQLAYLLGWMAHIVGDSLIKSIQPGVDLNLLDGKYTPRNRPIQDLYTFHEVGVKEFGLHWPTLLTSLARAPVEPIQFHYMRIAQPNGNLAASFPNAWAPQLQPLLAEVLKENRRYQQIRSTRLLQQYELTKTKDGWQCSESLMRQTGGHNYSEMLSLASRANFRHALAQISEAIVRLFEQVVARTPKLQNLGDAPPTWSEILAKWKQS